MEVQLIDIDGIKPYEKNPRKNDKAVDKVAKSFLTDGKSLQESKP